VARAAQRLGLESTIVVTQGDQAARGDEMARLAHAGAKLHVVPDGIGGKNEGQRAGLALALEHGPGTLFVSPLSASPFPYPAIVRELQGLSGLELKSQVHKLIERLPDGVIVSASDGMPAVGFLQAFLGSNDVKLFCVEAATGGSRTHRLGREHGWLRASGRVRYSSVPDEVARFAARYCMPDGAGELELGGGEVLVETFTLAKQFTPKQVVVVVLPADAH
jgi:tryptophan synthase beta subunit